MDEPSTLAGPRRDWPAVTCLLLLALGMRAWQLTHTEVAARDSIGYIRIAWQLEHRPWPAVVRNAPQHPLYPVTVLLASYPVRACVADLAVAMQLSAQLASAVAGVLLVLPTYRLGRELFDRRVGFWGALLFQTLPSSGRLMADGLSEPLFLLLTASALVCAVRALRGSALRWYALAGLCSGLAYLTRPEGALTAAATGIVLLAAQAVRGWRRPWGRCLACGATLTAAALVVALPFMLTVGHVTVKQSGQRLGNQFGVPKTSARAPVVSRSPLAWWDKGVDVNPPSSRILTGAGGVAQEMAAGFFYVAWVPALVGVARHAGLFRREPGLWVMALIAAGVTLSLYGVAVVIGYASERHLILVVLPGCYFAAAGLLVIGDGLARLLVLLRPGRSERSWVRGPAMATLLLSALCATAGAKSLERLHGDRGGFRQAGRWLAENAAPCDRVEDPYAWAHYYAGCVFDEVTPRPRPEGRPAVCYVVLETSANDHSHLRQAAQARAWATQSGRLVQSWKVPRGTVDVYEVPVMPPW
jgi:hypothetical protein